MPTALLIAAVFAVGVVLPGAAPAKQPRSAAVKHEFQLSHPGKRRSVIGRDVVGPRGPEEIALNRSHSLAGRSGGPRQRAHR
jgi:hypothetical protein